MRPVQSRRGAWQTLFLTAFSGERFKRVPIAALIPTQMTVGMLEVGHKRQRWRERSANDAANFLKMLRIPVVLGPGPRTYLLDRHHLALALHSEGIEELLVSIKLDISYLSRDAFWTRLEKQNWIHPFNAHGLKRPYNDMPKTLDGLQDDPFRSLSWAVKKAGGFAKDKSPFSEFRWADFFRNRIPLELVRCDFAHAQVLAMHIAHCTEAAALPGWRASAEAIVATPDGVNLGGDVKLVSDFRSAQCAVSYRSRRRPDIHPGAPARHDNEPQRRG